MGRAYGPTGPPAHPLEEPHRELDLWAWPSLACFSPAALGEPEALVLEPQKILETMSTLLSLRAPASHLTRDGALASPSVTLLRLISPVLESSKFSFVLGRVQVSPVSVTWLGHAYPHRKCSALPARSLGILPATPAGKKAGAWALPASWFSPWSPIWKLTAGSEVQGPGAWGQKTRCDR